MNSLQVFFLFLASNGGFPLNSFVNGGFGQGGGGTGGNGGGGGMGGGKTNGNLPPGYANIYGEIMDMTNKLIQRVTSVGTNYFTYDNQNGAPVFRRREVDSSRRFVLFPDANYPQGDGHYIVLRKMPGVNIPGTIPQALYEAYQLSLGDSIYGYVTNLNGNTYNNPTQTDGKMGGSLINSNGAASSGGGISSQGGVHG